jgi:hypothetical protein
MNEELPELSASNYAFTNYSNLGSTWSGHLTAGTVASPPYKGNPMADQLTRRIIGGGVPARQDTGYFHPSYLEEPEPNPPMSTRRIVQVFIADTNDNIPLEKSLLYQDERPHLSDLTDQELFFDLDVKAILEKHNEYRVTVRDKQASEKSSKDIMLEKAKIRDLKMTVVTVAQF